MYVIVDCDVQRNGDALMKCNPSGQKNHNYVKSHERFPSVWTNASMKKKERETISFVSNYSKTTTEKKKEEINYFNNNVNEIKIP